MRENMTRQRAQSATLATSAMPTTTTRQLVAFTLSAPHLEAARRRQRAAELERERLARPPTPKTQLGRVFRKLTAAQEAVYQQTLDELRRRDEERRKKPPTRGLGGES